jgi:hypothetical protein
MDKIFVALLALALVGEYLGHLEKNDFEVNL